MRACSTGCGAILAPERRINRCPACEREYKRRWDEQNQARRQVYSRRAYQKLRGLPQEPLPGPRGHRCADCEKRLKIGARPTASYCPGCERAKRRAAARNPDRRCPAPCGALLPVGRLSHYCPECDRRNRETRLAYARPCSGGCGKTLAAGQKTNLCPTCDGQYRQEYRERRKQQVKLCHQCRALVPDGRVEAICSDCLSIRGVEYRQRDAAAAGRPARPLVKWLR